MVKHTIFTYLLLSFTLLACSVEQEANNNSFQPKLITIQDNVERVIYDYTQSSDLGLNKMQAPVGWTEPIIKAQFELRGIVLEGVLGLEFIEGVQQIEAGLGFVIPRILRLESLMRERRN